MAWTQYTGYSRVCTKTLKGFRGLKISNFLKHFLFSHILWVYLTRKTSNINLPVWTFTTLVWDTLLSDTPSESMLLHCSHHWNNLLYCFRRDFGLLLSSLQFVKLLTLSRPVVCRFYTHLEYTCVIIKNCNKFLQSKNHLHSGR